MKVASCSIVRLENLYIREFVEHQKNIGFDKVFIYDHNLPDGERLEEVIDDYIQSGFVEVIDFRVGHKMGPAVMEAFQHCWDNYRKDFDWILFCDNDEFLTFTQDKNVKEYLSRNNIKDANIIKINWLCYDDNDLLYYDNRPLNERFTRPCNNNPYEFIENRHIKSFINCKTPDIYWVYNNGFETIYCGGAHCPCRFKKLNRKHGIYDNNKVVIDNSGNILGFKEQIIEHNITNINYELAYLKHFRMKTIEEYVNNKKKKLPENEYKNLDFNFDFFCKYNKFSEDKQHIYEKLINKNKNVCYTVIIGNYDTLKEPTFISKDFDYICFTDQDFKSDIWKIRQLPDEIKHLDNTRKNRYLKWMPHKFLSEYDFSIYIDGTIKPIYDLNDLTLTKTHKDIIFQTLPHPNRKNLKEEFDKCKKLKKDDINKFNNQIDYYINNKYDINTECLYHQCILLRYHNNNICKLIDEKVKDIILEYSCRDQLALPFALYLYNAFINIETLPKFFLNKYFNFNRGIHIKSINK